MKIKDIKDIRVSPKQTKPEFSKAECERLKAYIKRNYS